mmetsp:Transcript_62091/g.161336  ORF Transcript_62091/g.161336 Transcript_62091/m.161336 type:complete len:223 (+) Transcript_62091:238-906(+)
MCPAAWALWPVTRSRSSSKRATASRRLRFSDSASSRSCVNCLRVRESSRFCSGRPDASCSRACSRLVVSRFSRRRTTSSSLLCSCTTRSSTICRIAACSLAHSSMVPSSWACSRCSAELASSRLPVSDATFCSVARCCSRAPSWSRSDCVRSSQTRDSSSVISSCCWATVARERSSSCRAAWACEAFERSAWTSRSRARRSWEASDRAWSSISSHSASWVVS